MTATESYRAFVLLLLLTAGLFSRGSGQVEYSLAMPEPWTHLFHVETLFPPTPEGSDGLDVRMPVWRGGRYSVFDFSGGVVRFRAETVSGSPLLWQKRDKTTWSVAAPPGTQVRIRYLLYADEFQDRTRGLNSDHGFVDGSAVFMYADVFRRLPVRLKVRPFGTWHVSTGLDSIPGERFHYSAPDFDTFIDCPLEIGNQRDFHYRIDGIPHTFSFYGPVACNPDSLARDVERIVRANWEFWGHVPYQKFLFLFHAYPGGGGGTEHVNSAVMGIRPDPSRKLRVCRELIGLISHEFFHTWNVKQLRPRGMDPYDWTGENYYREIWLAEGGTSYLHNLLLLRAGFTDAQKYLRGLAGVVASDRRRPGNLEQSPAQCSFDLWVQRPRSTDRRFNFETDVYGRGAAVCLVLDLELRAATANRTSLDSLMRLLYRRFPLGSGGYTVQDVRASAVELGGAGLGALFDMYIEGSEPLPWERVLGYAGLLLEPADSLPAPWLGVELGKENGQIFVRSVVPGSPASRSGVSAGDQVIALDGYRVSQDVPEDLLKGCVPGDSLVLTVFREDRLRVLPVRLAADPVPQYRIRADRAAPAAQQAVYESWLRSPWPLPEKETRTEAGP